MGRYLSLIGGAHAGELYRSIDAGGKELVSSDWWRNISDVVIVSNVADQTKKETIRAFLKDWFLALKDLQEDLPGAASTISTSNPARLSQSPMYAAICPSPAPPGTRVGLAESMATRSESNCVSLSMHGI